MATITVTLDASWLGADDLTFTATRGGSTLATGAATLTALVAEGTLDLSAASLGPLTITLADADGNVAWDANYQLARDEVAGDLTSNLLIKSDFTADSGTTVANSGTLGAGTVNNPRAADAHFSATGGAQNGPCFDAGGQSFVICGAAVPVDVTYMFWCEVPAGTSPAYIAHINGQSDGIEVLFDGGDLFINYSDLGSETVTTGVAIGQPVVLAITVSLPVGGDSQVKVFANGVAVFDGLLAVAPYLGAITDAQPIVFCNAVSTKADAFRVWQRVLTPEEVLAATNQILGTDTSLTILASGALGGVGSVLFGF